ncbi:MAG: hypothetical protein ACXWQR_19370 [Ktedonobacterales bacterium]
MASDDLRQMIEDVLAPVKAGVSDLQRTVAGLVPRSEYDVRQQDIIARITDIRQRQDAFETWRAQRPQFSVSTEQFKSLQEDVAEIKRRPASMREWTFLGIAIFSALISGCGFLIVIMQALASHLH